MVDEFEKRATRLPHWVRHHWSKWGPYEGGLDLVDIRYCRFCNKRQGRRVRG